MSDLTKTAGLRFLKISGKHPSKEKLEAITAANSPEGGFLGIVGPNGPRHYNDWKGCLGPNDPMIFAEIDPVVYAKLRNNIQTINDPRVVVYNKDVFVAANLHFKLAKNKTGSKRGNQRQPSERAGRIGTVHLDTCNRADGLMYGTKEVPVPTFFPGLKVLREADYMKDEWLLDLSIINRRPESVLACLYNNIETILLGSHLYKHQVELVGINTYQDYAQMMNLQFIITRVLRRKK